ncbi:hypothetical protein BKA62DRAFT_811338 [Auriculariales sp. MPI-PUGE-AT-0066]|nr:hypothetical protein BKA62DRAFT_811338 [Auriculariales sp. MPI-PUGE-AT-0066]
MLSAAIIATSLALATGVDAFWRVACSGNALVKERADPIVSPGVTSNHVHIIHGGSAFSLNMTYDQTQASQCLSCQVMQDKSNYWLQNLWFQDPKTKQLEPVANGGILVYYLQRGNDIKNMKAFPKGFRMISGDMTRRNKTYTENAGGEAELRERATKWTCLRYTGGVSGYDGYGFPNSYCESGFQARLHLPNCWDGQNVDSADHKSHVAFMSLMDNGECPSTHPVSLMSLFYEQTWDINSYNSRWNPAVDKWPFLYSMGDPTGYGYHGDFLNGWDVTVLQNAITGCDNNTPGTTAGDAAACSFFTIQSADAAAKCTISPQVNEDIGGPRAKLPGCNPIQAGPGPATIYSTSNCPI